MRDTAVDNCFTTLFPIFTSVVGSWNQTRINDFVPISPDIRRFSCNRDRIQNWQNIASCLYVASKHFIWYNRRYRDNNSEYRYQIKRQWLKNFACSRRFRSIFCKYQSIYWMQLRTTILNLWDLVSNATGSSIWRIFDKSCVTRR